MKLVFATHNKNKFAEVKNQIPPEIELLSLHDIDCYDEIPETADTIEGNALQKALFVKENYGLDCFADDTGLEVDALGGAPGVFSARYAGEAKNAEANMNKLLEELKFSENRKAQFKTVIALVFQAKQELFTGICKGSITRTKQGEKGFGYDPIFKPENYGTTFAQMPLNEKNKLSHRGKAIKKLLRYLSQ